MKERSKLFVRFLHTCKDLSNFVADAFVLAMTRASWFMLENCLPACCPSLRYTVKQAIIINLNDIVFPAIINYVVNNCPRIFVYTATNSSFFRPAAWCSYIFSFICFLCIMQFIKLYIHIYVHRPPMGADALPNSRAAWFTSCIRRGFHLICRFLTRSIMIHLISA